MPVTNYYSANGVMIAEHTTGQSRLDYVNDALGSVIATVDQTLTVKSTARYKPYGAVLSETGTQPMYGWVGAPGYRRTSLPHTDIYVRKRHPSTVEGRWTTVDQIWPTQPAYEYGQSNATTNIDPSGMEPCQGGLPPGYPPSFGQGYSKCPGGSDAAICGWAANFPVNPPGKTLQDIDAASLICCDGKPVICQFTIYKSNAVNKCNLAHEKEHVPECNNCKGRPDGPCSWPQMQRATNECTAYVNTLKCLLKGCPSDPNKTSCQNYFCAYCQLTKPMCSSAGISWKSVQSICNAHCGNGNTWH